jgi:radical SAM protein with 4Fe4S-binding SPASM domain
LEAEGFLHRFVSPGGVKALFNALTLEITTDTNGLSPFDPESILAGYRSFCSSPSVTMATFFVTGDCPRKCGYCFVPRTLGTMTETEVDHGLQLLSDLAPAKADILIYGGEPLLKPEIVLRIIRGSGDDRNLCLATGGWDVSREVAHALAERNGFVIVSIDGASEVHNELRPLSEGDSYRSAVRTFHAFRDAGCRVGISLTVTKGNAPRVREDFGSLMETLKPDDMGLNAWMHPKPGRDSNPFEARWEDVFDAVTGCLSDALSAGMYVEQLFRRLRPLVTRTPRLRDCPSRGGRLVFVPGGGVSPCDCMAAAGVNTVRDGEGVKRLLSDFSRLVPVFRDECLSCPCVALCGGGCLYDAFACTGVLSGVREERCRYERALLRWMVGTILDKQLRDRTPGVLSIGEMTSFLPDGILERARMPQPEAMLGGEMTCL